MYGREALRRLREQQASGVPEPATEPQGLAQVPLDAQYDDPDAVLHAWNGERWVTWQTWLATTPALIEAHRDVDRALPADAERVSGDCSGIRVWLVKDGERWLMYVGARKAGARRGDFASPFLGHAIRTAEQWFGVSGAGWQVEKRRNGKRAGRDEAADLPPQDSTAEEGPGKRELDDLDLGWR